MKFLIDECLSPELAKLARERGFPESSHVRWLGLAGARDHMVARRAVDDGNVLVTHNTTDFRGLYGREELHVGLVAFNTAPGLMSLDLQRGSFFSPFPSSVARGHGTKCWRLRWMSSVPSPWNDSTSPTDGPPRSFPSSGCEKPPLAQRKSPPREEVRRA
ncbi:DUF5615 family PIN-like protein [Mesorhizobium sp. M0220]|uniref:DUF5615 family PIN-like protein n=1 Tax=Mesorhizobium sp. M0220 TaxID=2956920 RepID=UPI003339B2F4